MRKGDEKLPAIGWVEWFSFPRLGIDAIKGKIDTGARTSSIHTWYIEPFFHDGVKMVRFGVHPLQEREDISLICTTEIFDKRRITNSGGHREWRYIIRTPITFRDTTWLVEMTLAKRDTMKYRLLIGRTAIVHRFLVDPSRNYSGGKIVKP